MQWHQEEHSCMIQGSSECKEKNKKNIAEQWRVHRSEHMGGEAYLAPGRRSHGMARQCSRGRSSCKSREVVSVTPTSSSPPQAQHPGDDDTGDATTSPALGLFPGTGECRWRWPHPAGDHRSSEMTSLQI
jgi:hypothetical protein